MKNRQICGLTLRSSITLGLLAWLTILILIVCGLFLFSGQASASSHISTTFDLNNCRVGEKVETAESAQYQDIYYSNFYFCNQDGDRTDGPPLRTSICIPFVPGTNDFSIYGLSGLETGSWSQSTTGGTWSRYPVLIQRYAVELGFSSTDIRTINCLELPSYRSFVVSCDFILDENRPSDQKPFTTTNLNSCTLEATQSDPPEFDGPQGDREYPLGRCESYSHRDEPDLLSVHYFYKCQSLTFLGPGLNPLERIVCFNYTPGATWSATRQGETFKYAVRITKGTSFEQYSCSDLPAELANRPNVDPSTLEFFVVCRLNLFASSSGRTQHPVNISWLNQFCILTADWDAPPPPSSPSDDDNNNLPPGEGFDEAIKCDQGGDDCGFLKTVNDFLGWLAFLVVPVVIIVVIIGGIQLSLAGDNPEGTKKAKARITQAIVALICYVLLWSVLRWLI